MTGLCTQCGTVLRADGVSEWWCSPDCQIAWQRKGFDPFPTPARPEWRMGQAPAEEPVAAPWTDRRAARARAAVDGADGYPVDPAALDWPAPPWTRENPATEREPGGVSAQDTPPASAHQGIIRRILNATRSTT